MFECAELGCSNRVSHRGRLCGMCSEQYFEGDDHDENLDNDSVQYLYVKCGERDMLIPTWSNEPENPNDH